MQGVNREKKAKGDAMEFTGRQPRGVDLMRKLLELVAAQEGIEISCTIRQGDEVLTGTTGKDTWK